MFTKLAQPQIIWQNIQLRFLPIVIGLLLIINYGLGAVCAEERGVPGVLAPTSIVEVSTPEELSEALRNSIGGEKIFLKPGSYGSLDL